MSETSRAWYWANRERARAIARAYYERNRERLKARASAAYYADREKKKEAARAYHAKHRATILARVAAWKRANKGKVNELNTKWRNSNRGKMKQFRHNWNVRNPHRLAAIKARRIFVEQQATPRWVDQSALEMIYTNCPDGHQVDHIVPLCGKNVTGLHVPWNLQYLPALENARKGRAFDG